MKKMLILVLCMGLIPMFAEQTSDAPDISNANARINPNPGPQHVDTDGRAFGDILLTIDLTTAGMPGDGYDNAGITWDGQYVYLISMYDNNVYVIDPTGTPSVVNSFAAAPSLSWGCGSEQLLWMTEYNTISAYEYTWTGSATGNSFGCLQGGASWMGDMSEWWQDGEIWILAVGGSNKAYKFTVPGGTVTDSISDPAWTSTSQRGFSYDPFNDKFFVGGWNSDMVWELNNDGSTTGRQFAFSDIASLAYDWQSTIHPTPVIWLATNSATNTLYMIDADNPAPQTFPWDFEDGLQGWTHTNGQSFPAGWDVEASGYLPAYTPPNAGDSTMWIDSDAGGNGFWIQDTALSPAVVPPTNMAWLVYGVGFEGGSGSWINDLYVGIYHFTGGAWTAVQLAYYPNGTSYVGQDTLDVSAYNTADSIRVWFYFDDNDTWAYVAAFDNVGLYAPPDHDAGTIAINAPPTTIMPSTTINPSATYRNFGGVSETFDVYFTIDSAGTILYSETQNLTVPASSDTTIVYTNTWTSGPIDGIVYDITAWTVLSGDTDPSNDTLTQTTTTQSSYWKTYTSSLPQASYYNAVVAIGSQTVYSVGGNPTYTSIFEFDCATETWSTSSATLNHEAQRTAAAVVDGKIYVMGGADAGFTAHNYCQEYDPVAGTVTDKTPLPTARHFNGALTWNDTLIYVLGGQSSSYHNVIEIYDPANDAWTTATPLPEANRSFACGIAGDIIYVTGGYSGSGYRTATRIGVIDPTNPQSIAWSSGPDVPLGPSGTAGRSRLQGACVETDNGWVFYFTCGDDHGVAAYDTWYYDPNDLLWHQDFDKPTPISNSQCAVYVPNPFDGGTFFCAGGYNTASGSGTAATEGLVNIGTGIYETPPVNQGFAGFGFAAMANPSKGMISYVTSTSGKVVLKAYDASGRLVGTLVNSVQPAGVKTVNWDTNNIANGVYFLRLDAQGETATHKMILVK